MTLILIMTMCWILPGYEVNGGWNLVLLDDAGDSPGSWTMWSNKVASATWLEGGPPNGNPGSYYYFTNSSGGRDVGSARISRDAMFNDSQKILSDLGQLKVDFHMDAYGWDDGTDNVTYKLYSLKGGAVNLLYDPGQSFLFHESWFGFSEVNKTVPQGTDGIRIEIIVERDDGSDLDVYLDNIRLTLHEETQAAISDAAVTGIRDKDNNVLPLKKDPGTGEYLENWVSTSDTILGRIDFNEPVAISAIANNLDTNIRNGYGNTIWGSTGGAPDSYSGSHEYSIPLAGADRLNAGDAAVKLIYNSNWGPFNFPVYDIGGNYGLSQAIKPNIGAYNIKLDNAAPAIITAIDSFEGYVRGRTSVDLVVREQNRGTEQSPLTMKYYWKYGNDLREPAEGFYEVAVSNNVVPVVDETNTTYTVGVNIPNGEGIQPYQEFELYAEVNDEARNYSGILGPFKVNQRDSTPPAVTWDKSILQDGTEIDLTDGEDTVYAKSRTVYVNIDDSDSDVSEVRYLWTRESYNEETDTISNMVLPGGDGRYAIEGAISDTPLEGMYYLNILATNGTEESSVAGKGFFFDNQAPRISGSVTYEGGNPVSAQYQVSDRALQGKFLYALLPEDELVTEPDISEGIKDDGMWKALMLQGEGETQTAGVNGILDKITGSGDYKLFTRYYDENYNYTETAEDLRIDITPPYLEVVDAGAPGTFKKNHSVELKVHDLMSEVSLSGDKFSIDWVDAVSGDVILVSPVIDPEDSTISITGNEAMNGRYYLRVKAADACGNIMEESVFVSGSRAEFCFDNSPPSVNLEYANEKASGTIKFTYAQLNDTYAGVALFKYGISASPDIMPSAWQELDPDPTGGEIVYPYEFTEDGEWYLTVLLRDNSGNERSITSEEPFAIDVTDPAGGVSFDGGYTNKPDTFVHLEVDELKGKGTKVFKTILSDVREELEDAALSDAQPEDWKEITYENGSAVYSWSLEDTADGEQKAYARFMDEAGNLSEIYEAAVILDRTAPEGEVTYDRSTTEPVKGNITASLSMSDNYGASVLNNNLEGTYVFNRNGEFEFIIADEAGNKTRIRAGVSNIDKTPPRAYIEYSHPRDTWTNEAITAKLHLEDVNGFNILSGDGDTHVFDENGEYLFEYEDGPGNKGSILAEVHNIDRKAPKGSITYTSSDTAPVTVYLEVDEPVKVTNNEGSFRYVFDENGEFTFEFEDKAGNTGEATAYIYAITSPEKYVDVLYSDSGRLTNESVEVSFIPVSDKVRITEPTVTGEVYGTYSSSFNENGEVPVTFEILAGEEAGSFRTVVGSVQNIDITPPSGSVILSTESPTNQPVSATLLPADDRGKTITITNNNGEPEYIFEESGSFTFEFKDEAGNTGHKEVAAANIDRSVPAADIRYFTEETRDNVIFAELIFPEETEEIEILNNNGSNIFEFVENGAFTFRYADRAGNSGEATAQVDSLSGGELSGAVKYYIGETELADPNGSITNKSVTASLVTNEEDGPCHIINNGGSSSYTFEKNGEFTFEFEDAKGNRGFATAKVSSIDKEAPKLNILADTVKATNKNVTITASYSDNKEISGVTLNGQAVADIAGGLTYICGGNETIRITAVDTAGNTTLKEFIVDYIDKVAPTATMVYTPDSLTNKNVKAILTLNEPGMIINNSGKMEYSFSANGEFTFEFQDIAGNKASKTAGVSWIDKLPPSATLEYSNNSATNKPVEVTVKSDEAFIVSNNGGSAKRTFYRNGEFTFKLRDEAGNEKGMTAEVGNIDMDKPQITLEGAAYVGILQGEAYTEAGYRAGDNVDGDITDRVITEGSVNTEVPGIYILKYKVSDEVGNSSEVSRTVKIIGHDELVLLLNDKVVDGEQAVLEGTDVKVSILGNEGSYKIKWAEGRRTRAYFKTGGNSIEAGKTVTLEADSWYTIFIQDRERKTKSIQVYINE
jgi:hypothetical protein